MDVHQALQQARQSYGATHDYTTGGELEEDHLGLDIVLQTGDKKALPLGQSKQTAQKHKGPQRCRSLRKLFL